MPTRLHKLLLFLVIVVGGLAVSNAAASACGGFFCRNLPVDQTGERIVFTVNDDDTITTLIEIQYQGEADDFSWILPIPEAIDASALEVPEDGDLVFDELHALTDVQIIAPEPPECAVTALAEMAMEDSATSVEVFASGEVGPFGFDIVGSTDPDALIEWLRDNDYQVTADMEPLIDIYVEAEMAFVAMRLLDGETSDSIQPIEITYGGTQPMIPLQLTAVAAQPNMAIWVWFFADHRAVPVNFEHMEIATEEISFFTFGGNDYTFLVQQRANALDGHAFITEYAMPTPPERFEHPWLVEQATAQPYLTRLGTYIDPEEMTADPVFDFDAALPEVSNVRDASGLSGLYGCERSGDGGGFLDAIFGGGNDETDAIDPMDGGDAVVAMTPVRAERSTETATPTTAGQTNAVDASASNGQAAAPTGASDGGPRRGVLVTVLGVLAALGVGATIAVRRGARTDLLD